jgi:hypothetical protein
MGKASRKKGPVKAKARKGSTGFVVLIAAIFVVGVALIALAKNNNSSSKSAKGPGAKLGDHWHAAIGINFCGTWQANLPQYEPTPNTGVHSHGDGFMHLHPFSAAGAGRNANVGLFYRQAGDKVSATQIKYGKQTYKNGDVCDNLGKKPGLVRWSVNGQERTGNPADYAPNDRDVIALAFVPKDADIGTPPVAVSGSNPSDVSS